MDRRAIAERLRALASDDAKRSKAARLRDVIDDVEAALSAGISRSLVVEELAAHGLEMTLPTFETTLKRIRQKKEKLSVKKSPSNSQVQLHTSEEYESTPTTETELIKPITGSHNPADLDKIIGSTPDLSALAKLAKRKKK